MTQLLQNAACGTAMILAAALLRRVLKDRLLPGARLALWAVCLFRLLTPAAPESALSLWGLTGLFAPEEQAAPVSAAPSAPAPAAPLPSPQAGPGIAWETVLPAVWLAVGAALAAWYAVSWARTRRAVARAVPLGREDPRYAPLPRCARLREGPMEGAPLTFGVARPTVVLSPGLGGAELDCVLAHEGVHAARRHNLWHYAMALALAVHWWNPAVWLMSRLLRRDIELSCDRAALNRLGPDRRTDYANTLVSLSAQAEGPAFCQTFGRKATEERILSIMKFKKTSIIGVIFTLALVLALTAAFASEPKGPAANPLDKVVPGMTEEQVHLLLGEPSGGLSGLWGDIYGEAVIYYDSVGKVTKVKMPGDDTVIFHGQVHSRAELSQKTLDWLDWYLALPEEEQLAISSVPAELAPNETPDSAAADDAQSDLYDSERIASYKVVMPEADGDGSPVNSGIIGSQYYTYEPAADPDAVSGSVAVRTYTLCADSDCDIAGTHYHDGGGVVYLDSPAPSAAPAPAPAPSAAPAPAPSAAPAAAQPLVSTAPIPACGVAGCAETRYHYHSDGQCVLLSAPCPVEGCTVLGTHFHDGVCYSCNGAGHNGGHCDGSCYVYGAQSGAASSGTVSSGSHHSGRHGYGHH